MARVKKTDVLFCAHQNGYYLSILKEREKAFKEY